MHRFALHVWVLLAAGQCVAFLGVFALSSRGGGFTFWYVPAILAVEMAFQGISAEGYARGWPWARRAFRVAAGINALKGCAALVTLVVLLVIGQVIGVVESVVLGAGALALVAWVVLWVRVVIGLGTRRAGRRPAPVGREGSPGPSGGATD